MPTSPARATHAPTSTPTAATSGLRWGPCHTAADLVRFVAADRPDSAMFHTRHGDRVVEVSAAEFHDRVVLIANGLIEAGIEQGDRIGLLCSTRLEWALADFAIWFAGAVSVPIYDSSSQEQIRWVLHDAQAVGCVVETADHHRLVASARPELPDLQHVWGVEVTTEHPGGDELSLADLERAGTADQTELGRRRASAGTDDVATIIYTSGTTGRPKGCELTHRHLLSETSAVTDVLDPIYDVARGDCTVLFLPLAHVFARVIQLVCINAGVPLAHSSGISTLLDDLGRYRPRFVLGVPRVFEKVHDRAAARAGRSAVGARLFAAASKTAVDYSRAQSAPGPIPLALRARHGLFALVVYRRLRAALGGRARFAVSGGAALGEHLTHFYRGVGITVLEGYGLTETTAAITLNPPLAARVGSVGQVLAGNQVRIAPDGEVEVTGSVVFDSYRGHERRGEAWFATGDVGRLDSDGYLYIVGRKKDMLITAGGKNVYPAPWESQLAAHRLVDHAMVVGDARPYIAALITLDHEACRAWLQSQGHEASGSLAQSAAVHAAVAEAVDSANQAVSRAESIREFRILDDRWTVDGGELTPSMKLKRAHVTEQHRSQIESLYTR